VLAVCGGDDYNFAQLWDSTTGKELRRCEGHTKRLTDVRFNRGGKLVLTASEDATARIWDTTTAKELRVLTGHKGKVFIAKFSADEKRIITSSDDATAKVWDAATVAEIRSFPHPAPVEMAELNLDGFRLLTRADHALGRGLSRPVAVLWDVGTGKKVTEIPLPGIYGRNHALFSPDGNSFFVTLHRYAILCSSKTGEPIRDYR
jgi:WD40 repeat protein